MINFDADLGDVYYFCPHIYDPYFRMFSKDNKGFKFFPLSVNIKLEKMS